MRIHDYDEYLDDEDSIPLHHRAQKLGTRHRRSKHLSEEIIDPRDLPIEGFRPTYTGSRHELHWILTYLLPIPEIQMLEAPMV